MTPRHHLDGSTLVSYAAGALSEGMLAVAATHLEVCGHCRAMLADAERIGGLLLLLQCCLPGGGCQLPGQLPRRVQLQVR